MKTQDKLAADSRCTQTQDVHRLKMYTDSRCTDSRCTQTQDIHRLKMYTATRCTQLQDVHSHKMYTATRCTQPQDVHSYKMYTATRCTQLQNVHSHKMVPLKRHHHNLTQQKDFLPKFSAVPCYDDEISTSLFMISYLTILVCFTFGLRSLWI